MHHIWSLIYNFEHLQKDEWMKYSMHALPHRHTRTYARTNFLAFICIEAIELCHVTVVCMCVYLVSIWNIWSNELYLYIICFYMCTIIMIKIIKWRGKGSGRKVVKCTIYIETWLCVKWKMLCCIIKHFLNTKNWMGWSEIGEELIHFRLRFGCFITNLTYSLDSFNGTIG